MVWFSYPPPTARSAIPTGRVIGDRSLLSRAAEQVADVVGGVLGVLDVMPEQLSTDTMQGPRADELGTGLEAEREGISDLGGLIADLRAPLDDMATAIDSANEAWSSVASVPWPEDVPIPHPSDDEDEGYAAAAQAYGHEIRRAHRAAGIREAAVAAMTSSLMASQAELQGVAEAAVSLSVERHGVTLTSVHVPGFAGVGAPVVPPDLQRILDDPEGHLEDLAEAIRRAKELGLPITDLGQVLKVHWEHQAAEAAGIDLDAWDPAKGAYANADTIYAVYEYYRELYKANPDLNWAGMGYMVGPSFAAGFFDLALYGQLAESGDLVARGALPFGPAGPGIAAAGMLAEMSAEDFRFFETKFLEMQQAIFKDIGVLHEAYQQEGLSAVDDLIDSGALKVDEDKVADLRRAWELIAEGDPAGVEEATRLLVYREQRDIIQEHYTDMQGHRFGMAVTQVFSIAGRTSIPGTRRYNEVFPHHVSSPRINDGVPGVDVRYSVNVGEGNIAEWPDRRDYILADTLPSYFNFVGTPHADQMIEADFPALVAEQRMGNPLDELWNGLEPRATIDPVIGPDVSIPLTR